MLYEAGQVGTITFTDVAAAWDRLENTRHLSPVFDKKCISTFIRDQFCNPRNPHKRDYATAVEVTQAIGTMVIANEKLIQHPYTLTVGSYPYYANRMDALNLAYATVHPHLVQHDELIARRVTTDLLLRQAAIINPMMNDAIPQVTTAFQKRNLPERLGILNDLIVHAAQINEAIVGIPSGKSGPTPDQIAEAHRLAIEDYLALVLIDMLTTPDQPAHALAYVQHIIDKQFGTRGQRSDRIREFLQSIEAHPTMQRAQAQINRLRAQL